MFLANHFCATGSVISGDNLDSQFAQKHIALCQRLWMRNNPLDIAQLLPRLAEQTVIDRVSNLANHKQIMLAQQVVDIVDATRLRILNGYQTVLNLAGGDGTKDIGKTPIGKWFRCERSLFPEIGKHGLISKRTTLSLKSNPYHRRFSAC